MIKLWEAWLYCISCFPIELDVYGAAELIVTVYFEYKIPTVRPIQLVSLVPDNYTRFTAIRCNLEF